MMLFLLSQLLLTGPLQYGCGESHHALGALEFFDVSRREGRQHPLPLICIILTAYHVHPSSKRQTSQNEQQTRRYDSVNLSSLHSESTPALLVGARTQHILSRPGT